ncbi:exodeoxyribonuclease I [Desulfobacter hydrogenophilus]|uniref:Exodeoxyribonuclease I n=1 Tax=Desulfobacter hydrogenophilus TaxID=2291 RepID=A0A328FBK8_9BACT|nr:exodeoxyribonuclease I [Desulfobacter hydrogenophilus]NDY72026.1 exodeoxyribonuclease I [Desulfobacter hydrogenophilus]QBH11449.1 exodeoxyribonuclease I [Desulfobacter hydrogenophilus]RAM01948.1 exodeoxyribonuclease I [Desulfobacter hydrogenophilus]
MQTLLFYDIETSGLNPAFDQVLTFACIRTDLSLNEIGREDIVIRLRKDIVPSPWAFLTHKLDAQILETGICEYDAALKIHGLLNTPQTISIGYNSLGFDDEFLRFLFYRNLLDPYSHQFANGCSRMDMLPITLIYYLFCAQALSWPVLENGQPTMKLEHLTRQNKFKTSGRAHEAMSDVESVVGLAEAFSKYSRIWSYVQSFFDKNDDLKRMNSLQSSKLSQAYGMDLALMVSVSFGADCNYMAPVVYVGGSVPYKNQSLWIRLDKDRLFDRIDEAFGVYDLITIRKKPGDQLFILPVLDRFWEKLSPGSRTVCIRNLDFIKQNMSGFDKTVSFHQNFKYPQVPDIDPDADLYQSGFFSFQDKKEIAIFHKAEEKNRCQIAQGFQSDRVRMLAQRILVRNFNENPGCAPEFCAHLKCLCGSDPEESIKGYKADVKLTCAKALDELEKIETETMQSFDSGQKDLLKWLKVHIQGQLSFFADAF